MRLVGPEIKSVSPVGMNGPSSCELLVLEVILDLQQNCGNRTEGFSTRLAPLSLKLVSHIILVQGRVLLTHTRDPGLAAVSPR